MSIPSFTASAPSFGAHFQTPLPRALRDDAASMSHDAFLARYAPSSGPLRLGHWRCTDVDRPASRLGPQARNYQATIAVGAADERRRATHGGELMEGRDLE